MTKICPLCKSGASVEYRFRKNGYEIYGCTACHFAFVGDLPERNFLEAHYSWDYFHGDLYRFGYLDYGAERNNRLRAFKSKQETIDALYPNGGRLLDIGCADGSFLSM